MFLMVVLTDINWCLQIVRQVKPFPESFNLWVFDLCYSTMKLTTSADFVFQVIFSYFCIDG